MAYSLRMRRSFVIAALVASGAAACIGDIGPTGELEGSSASGTASGAGTSSSAAQGGASSATGAGAGTTGTATASTGSSGSGTGGASSSGAGGSTTSSSSSGAGGSTTTTSGAGGTSSSSSSSSSSGQGGGSTDPYEAARIVCINKINELRATKGAPAYARWSGAEVCADGQANSDQQSSTPHGAFGQCGENGQNECLGQGVAGIESCLESMWAEKDQPGCAGCDACADAYNPNCPNCDFYGDQTGDVCGHYVNMRALYFSEAACGFSDQGGWAVIDFR
jgi:hypothetical protein